MTVYLKTATGNEQDRAQMEAVRDTVATVIADVRERGDAAVREYSERFDGWSPTASGWPTRRSRRSSPECRRR